MTLSTTATITAEIDGSPLDPAAESLLVRAVVDDSLTDPDLFELTFRDPDRELLSQTGLSIGSTVRIAVLSSETAGDEELIQGEVTTLEARYDPLGTMTVVRGFDHSHRLFRGRRTRGFESPSSYEEIVRAVASDAGIEVGRVDGGPRPPAHVTQANVTDIEFLRWLARDIGFEVVVVQGELQFRRPAAATDGPAPGGLDPSDPLQLSLGVNLLRFRATVSASEQVTEVEVRGWDQASQRPLVGTAPATSASAETGVAPAELAEAFGSPRYVGTKVPYVTQEEVDEAAVALATRIADAHAEFDGVAVGTPQLRAGVAVSLDQAGAPFDGRYLVTSARHVLDPEQGYSTAFTVSGAQPRTLLALTAGGGAAAADGHIPGVVIGIVSDILDPDERGRVRLTFPWLSDDFVSDWARVVAPGAGAQRGVFWFPEVHDEVLVAFDHGDVRRPYVVGSLYHSQGKPQQDAYIDATTGEVDLRSLRTRAGHELAMNDGSGQERVTLSTADGSGRIELDQAGTRLTIHDDGKVVVEGREVQIEAQGNLTMAASGNAKLEANGTLELKGSLVRIN